jgi:uncharacterized protein (DUF4415 family)
MPTKQPDTAAQSIDPDDAPELDEDFFATAQISKGDVVLRQATATYASRGRPRLADPKQLVSIRLDRVVVEKLRAEGPGWQSRVNELLRKAVGV